ncbi:MAG: UvrD-helicase domain-containing protein, partial [Planctomycetota bacterium]
EYRFVKCLAKYSTIVALADPDQRIYEFRGADPKRIPDFVADFAPVTFDLARRNHRSDGTDILEFANDLLTKTAAQFVYDDVKITTFPTRTGAAQHFWMKTKALKAVSRAAKRDQDWSVAILVPTKSLMLTVSDYLATEQEVGEHKLPMLHHEVAVDAEGPSLAGVTIGRLLECPSKTLESAVDNLIADVCTHIVGRKGGRPPSQTEIKLIEGVEKFLTDRKVRGSKRQLVVNECKRIVESTMQLDFTGDPFVDWIAIRSLFEESTSPVIKCLGADAKYLRFLRKGTTLRSRLSELWRARQSYEGSMACVKNAFIQEHFTAKSQKPRGLYVMTIHKSKGKEFDEVVIYEGVHRDRIVRDTTDEKEVAQAILSLRVAASRARHRVTLLTPKANPCPLF